MGKEFFYHLKPEKMIGNKLVSLSSLKDIDSKEYKKYKKKYSGREKFSKRDIPILDCTWEDVIFFSCVNPTIIFTALQLLGLYDDHDYEILKFPIEVLKNKDFCWYVENKKEKFKKVTVSSYREEDYLPHETAQYFVDCLKSKEDPLIFSGIPHLLLKGDLDIKLAKVIKYKPLEM